MTILTTFLGLGHTSDPSAPSSWKITGLFSMADLLGLGGGKGLTFGLGKVLGGTFCLLLLEFSSWLKEVSAMPLVEVMIGGKRGIMGGISSSNL